MFIILYLTHDVIVAIEGDFNTKEEALTYIEQRDHWQGTNTEVHELLPKRFNPDMSHLT